MTFLVTDPLTKLYTPIEEIQELGKAAKLAYTPEQLIKIGLTVLKRTSAYDTALNDWYKKPATAQTWVNFKTHFQAAQKLLKKIRGQTLGQTQLANALTEEVRTVCEELNSLQNTQTTMLQAVSDNQSVLQQMANTISSEVQSNLSGLSADDNTSQHVNAASQPQNNGELLGLIRTLQAEIAQLRNSRGPNRNNGGGRWNNNYRRRTGGRNNRRNYNNPSMAPSPQQFQNFQNNQPIQYPVVQPPPLPVQCPTVQPPPGFQNPQNGGQQNFQRQQWSSNQGQRTWRKYCWTHGVCGHNSNECSTPAPGHQPQETFNNRLGGNNYSYRRT